MKESYYFQAPDLEVTVHVAILSLQWSVKTLLLYLYKDTVFAVFMTRYLFLIFTSVSKNTNTCGSEG